jgi:hypothetical protein
MIILLDENFPSHSPRSQIEPRFLEIKIRLEVPIGTPKPVIVVISTFR